MCHASLADKISDSPEKLEKSHGLSAKLVYVEIGVEHYRLPPFPYLATAALGLCVGIEFSCKRTSFKLPGSLPPKKSMFQNLS